jgi:hypothetical protein
VGCYHCESHAVPSRDGRRVVWASNWSARCTLCGGPADIKDYVVDARDDLGNVVGNPSFEYSTIGWASFGGAVAVRINGGVDGYYGARVTGGSTAVDFGLNDSPNWVGSATAGMRYRATAWVRSVSGLGQCAIKLREYQAGKQVGSTARSPWVSLSPEWGRLLVEYVAQANASTIDLQIVDSPAAAGEQFEVDDIVIAPVPNSVTAVGDPELDPEFPAALAPNPLRVSSRLEFVTATDGPVSVRVFDVHGRTVRTLLDAERLVHGVHRIALGDLAGPNRLPAGVYFCRVESPTGRVIRRFVVLE